MKFSISPVLLTLLFFCFSVSVNAGKPSQVSKPGLYKGYSNKDYHGYQYHSLYIPMRDSVLLAVDVFLPKHLEEGKKVPTILYLTRYVRSIEAKPPFNLLKDPVLAAVSEGEIKYFTSYGYACVIVDVRGTGASLGPRRMEFSPEEIADGKDIVDWIIAQPWSDKNVGTTGVSYLGTTAEMLLANKHPNVKACIPRSAIFDLYDDMIFPGGVCAGPFVDVWGSTTKALDNNNFLPFGKIGKLVRGIHPVQGEKGREYLAQAVALHKKNFDVSSGVQNIKYRDDLNPGVNACMNDFSVHSRLKQIEASGTAIYRIDGWYDGGLAKGCIDATQNTSNTRKVLIGPWDHGPRNNVSPYSNTKKVKFKVKDEMLRFFDHYLKGINNGIDAEPLYTYFSVGEETWKTSEAWPPKNEETMKMYLSSDKSLATSADKLNVGSVNYNIDYTATSGNTSRWNSLTTLYMHGHSNYEDRKTEDQKLLSFTSTPLSSDKVLAGNPMMYLNLAADANDATVFCYLEDVGPDGSVTYVTEGMMRPMDRKLVQGACYKTCYPNHSFSKVDGLDYKKDETVQLTFNLLPISYQFKQGHSVRVSVAGADVGHFNFPDQKPTRFTISSDKVNPSYVELPVMK
ncbi:MAG: hypothetical protein JWO06_2950 [Bacteroidota bacterium]|nr:hypothetical protein [Bacteroidota bacterium]